MKKITFEDTETTFNVYTGEKIVKKINPIQEVEDDYKLAKNESWVE